MPSREDARPRTFCRSQQQATFQGFRRANGKVGTRNYLGILTTVNCSATVARFIAEEVERSGILDDYPEHRRRRAARARHRLRHRLISGEGFEVLKRTQWGYATNPNMGGVLMVGPRLRGASRSAA